MELSINPLLRGIFLWLDTWCNSTVISCVDSAWPTWEGWCVLVCLYFGYNLQIWQNVIYRITWYRKRCLYVLRMFLSGVKLPLSSPTLKLRSLKHAAICTQCIPSDKTCSVGFRARCIYFQHEELSQNLNKRRFYWRGLYDECPCL